MIDSLTTYAELEAEKALSLQAFDAINLLGIKRAVETLLSLIGRGGIFEEFTSHDISHIDAMLNSLDWLVPDATKKKMTPADWLMTVLAIYFHDVGMLVTKDEYAKRETSDFPQFCENKLFAGNDGIDYKARVEKLPPDDADRFLYQEFVRYHHAQRINNWIMGKAPVRLGVSHAAMDEIVKVLGGLNDPFRRDLGLVCESHHLDDLGDLKKYPPSQPYGNTETQTANVQYCAILLRTADLLHITLDRTPSVAFRIINPKDPVSQREWAKQRVVRCVRPKIGLNQDNKPDQRAPRDTIEVFARFTTPEGFFGLTSYLKYAQDQLRRCADWSRQAHETRGSLHQFLWRVIDESQVEASGFLPQSFEFTLDQAKILDLLTGHTLYNDPSVTLRELVQNALDAIRLQSVMDHRNGAPVTMGRVEILWDSVARRLTVRDNGTGMTQDTIERHLLKVGASRYQEEDFKRRFPEFSPISRFGIGILSSFMISDNVEIATSHPEDGSARFLSLRSVHGKYLVRLMDKDSQDVPEIMRVHGTNVSLTVRPSARLPSILDIARNWIVFPHCAVFVRIDDQPFVKIGFDSPRQALEFSVRGVAGMTLDGDADDTPYTRHRVEEVAFDGITIAYLLRWWDYYKVWSFAPIQPPPHHPPMLGACIEGIRINYASPGFDVPQAPIGALVNATGPRAPRTNVARTAIEATEERDAMLRAVYRPIVHTLEPSSQRCSKKGASL